MVSLTMAPKTEDSLLAVVRMEWGFALLALEDTHVLSAELVLQLTSVRNALEQLGQVNPSSCGLN